MSAAQRPTVLFVPGALTGGWIWQRDFMPCFAAAGFAVQAVTFPSHVTAGWRRQRLGLQSAVAHLASVVAALPAPPFVIAHSLGGFVTMQLLRQQPLAGVALLSPIPSDGAWRSLLHLARRSPVSLAKLAAVMVDARVTRYGTPPVGIYSDRCDPALAESITRQLRAESLRTLGETLWRPRRALPTHTPLHFFGAEGDHIIPAREMRRMAAVHRAPVTIYPGMSHTFQAEPDWQRVADDVLAWFRQLDEHVAIKASSAA